jgi:hypothetical protein
MSSESLQSGVPGDAISELARQRREIAERESTRPRPDFIQSVEHSEVIYYFLPVAIPFRQINIPAVSDALASQYEVRIAGPDFSPLLASFSLEQLMAMSEEEKMAHLVRTDDVRLRWTDGKFPLRDDFVPIRLIAFTFEAVQVAVAGVSQVAEVIVKEVVELVWQLAGAKKKFSDVERFIKLRGYGTVTRLELGYGPECLLNPAITEFLNSNLAEGKHYADSMGVVAVGNEVKNLNAVAAFDDLTLRINTFNPMSGYSDSSEVQFSVTGSSDYTTGLLRARSSMPYEQHVEFLSGMFQAVTDMQ